MEGVIEKLLVQLQKELECANVQSDSVSTMARIGDSQACNLLMLSDSGKWSIYLYRMI